jgi:hypothetical protein
MHPCIWAAAASHVDSAAHLSWLSASQLPKQSQASRRLPLLGHARGLARRVGDTTGRAQGAATPSWHVLLPARYLVRCRKHDKHCGCRNSWRKSCHGWKWPSSMTRPIAHAGIQSCTSRVSRAAATTIDGQRSVPCCRAASVLQRPRGPSCGSAVRFHGMKHGAHLAQLHTQRAAFPVVRPCRILRLQSVGNLPRRGSGRDIARRICVDHVAACICRYKRRRGGTQCGTGG